jgi:hypothetical protein
MYLDFSKDNLATIYLNKLKERLNFIPNYIIEPLVPIYKKVWERIKTDSEVLYTALIVLYINQTNDEKRDKASYYKNFEGFNKSEAKYLSLMSSILSETKELNLLQMASILPSLRKYLVQLLLSEDFMRKINMYDEYISDVIPHKNYLETIRRNG